MKGFTAWMVVIGGVVGILVLIMMLPVIAILGAIIWGVFNHN